MLSTKNSLRPLARRIIATDTPRVMTILSKESGEEYKKMNYTKRMQRTGRPVSPHLTIYAFPIGAITSIVNRVTGVMLSIGAVGLGAAEIAGGSGTSLAMMEFIGSTGGVVAATAKFSVAFPLTYHYFGAMRHLAWDHFPDYLNNVDVQKTSYVLAGSSVLVSGVLAVV